MTKDCIIIGGGVAGLSAAIRLAELGKTPIVLKLASIPNSASAVNFSTRMLASLAKMEYCSRS